MFAVEAAINTGTLRYYLTGEDVILSDFLAAQSAPDYKPIDVIIAEGTIIGGTGEYALLVDDVSVYDDITIKNYGDIQGARGGTAVKVTEGLTFINEGYTANDPNPYTITGDSNVTLHNMATGRILPGGGNGGNGGKGGNGDNNINRLNQIGPTDNQYEWWYGTTEATVKPSYYAGTHVFTNDTTGGGSTIYFRRIYYSGAWRIFQPGNITVSAQYSIKMSDYFAGTGGNGGSGGLGQGYNQASTNGAAGTAGTTDSRSGTGGSGGNGGSWGQNGATGNKGGVGYYITDYKYDNIRQGSDGSDGSLAGISINF